MSIDDLRKQIIATPFVPYALHIADGRSIPVIGRDFVLVPPNKARWVVVCQRNGDYDLLDPMLITGLSIKSVADVASSN